MPWGRGQVEVVTSIERDSRPVHKDLRWGVYVVIEAPNDYAAACFKQYGMNTDASGRYSAMYKPFHLIGLELNISILSAALLGQPTGMTKGYHSMWWHRQTRRQRNAGWGRRLYCWANFVLPANREIGGVQLAGYRATLTRDLLLVRLLPGRMLAIAIQIFRPCRCNIEKPKPGAYQGVAMLAPFLTGGRFP